MNTYEITPMEILAVKEALELSQDEFEAAGEDGFVLNSGAEDAVTEALVIINALTKKADEQLLEEVTHD